MKIDTTSQKDPPANIYIYIYIQLKIYEVYKNFSSENPNTFK